MDSESSQGPYVMKSEMQSTAGRWLLLKEIPREGPGISNF